ncbi:hypothetical protein BAL199_14932 [alpha proteobacterium BAL199]|nr:hypothetical protein BAL199_14932 [alpha proteobacterium BAL199]
MRRSEGNQRGWPWQTKIGAPLLLLSIVLGGPAAAQQTGGAPIDRIEDPMSRAMIDTYVGFGDAYNATMSTLYSAGVSTYGAVSWSGDLAARVLGIVSGSQPNAPLVSPELDRAIEIQVGRIGQTVTPPLPTLFGQDLSSASPVSLQAAVVPRPAKAPPVPKGDLAITFKDAAAIPPDRTACGFDDGKVDDADFDQVKKMVGQLKNIADSPRQMPDGTLFVPKTTQRLMMIRTALPCSGEARIGERLSGRVTADRISTGIVQASQPGRLEAAGDVFPYIGMRVTKGETLAVLRPVLPVTKVADINAAAAELEGEITKTELSLLRLREFPIVPFRAGRILSLRLQLDKLRKQRDAVLSALDRVEELRASASGIVSSAEGEIGEVVSANDVLWEIVDPANLWVEAVAYSGAQIDGVTDAYAVTADGRSFRLAYVGRGRRLEQQAIPLQFRIVVSDDTLVVDQPVTVYLRTGRQVSGLVVPSDAVVRGSSGQQIVFAHVTPERFEPRQVNTEPLDGDTVLVISGLDSSERLVTAGAHVLNQVR